MAPVRSIVKQGALGDMRASYWKFLLDAATRYRHAFGIAITLAFMGYHFQALTRRVCDATTKELPGLLIGDLDAQHESP